MYKNEISFLKTFCTSFTDYNFLPLIPSYVYCVVCNFGNRTCIFYIFATYYQWQILHRRNYDFTYTKQEKENQ